MLWRARSGRPCCVQYHRYIEIAIKQCRSSGIDCKIHGLVLLGRVRAEDEDWAAVPFLASDNEEEDDEKASGGRWASVPWVCAIPGDTSSEQVSEGGCCHARGAGW